MALHSSNNDNLEASPRILEEEYPESNEDKLNLDKSQENEKPEDIIKQMAKVMERHNWEAHPPKFSTMLKTPVNKVVLTWTETEQCMTEEECIRRVQDIQLNHRREDGVPDIKHNFLLGSDGALYEGRGFTQVGPKYSPSVDESYALTGQSIEIAFIDKCNGGHFNGRDWPCGRGRTPDGYDFRPPGRGTYRPDRSNSHGERYDYPKEKIEEAEEIGETEGHLGRDLIGNHPSPTLLKVLSECFAFGVGGRFIEPKFTIYWMAEEDVIHIEPTLLPCKGRI